MNKISQGKSTYYYLRRYFHTNSNCIKLVEIVTPTISILQHAFIRENLMDTSVRVMTLKPYVIFFCILNDLYVYVRYATVGV